MRKSWILALAVAVLAVPALAQDSLSTNLGGLPGDALAPWTPAYQCTNYVVDMTPFTSSWGTQFAIAPLAKSSAASAEFYDSLVSAQSHSRVRAMDVPFLAASYMHWTNAPGTGIHPTMNFAPGTLVPTGLSHQFGVAFSEYSYTDLSHTNAHSYAGIVTAVVNYKPDNPQRLYVHRVLAAGNSTGPLENRSGFGIGAVDQLGNTIFRAEGSSSPGPNTLQGNNVFWVDALARNCNALNYIDNAGMSDPTAGSWIVVQDPTYVYNTPMIGPKSVFGVPYFLGSNFNKEYAYGPATPPSYTTTTAHRPGAWDHRGGVVYTTRNIACLAGTHGTAAILVYVGAETVSHGISVWGLNANASVAGTQLLVAPAVITDPAYPAVTNVQPAAFDHYHSQVAYQGGNGPIAINVDPDGRLLLAGVQYLEGCGNQCPYSDIVAVRLGPTNCTPQWTLVAYSCDQSFLRGTGKPILNGPGGAVIGRMCELGEVNVSLVGPPVSAPMIDAGGNVWFIAACVFHKVDSQGVPYDDYTTALLRAVYNPVNFSYELERILELGYRFNGVNSGRKWKIIFMNLVDSNSIDSGSAWSSNMAQDGAKGMVPGPGWDSKDARSMGGMVLNAQIAYDANGDGTFDPNNPQDEEIYNGVLYINAIEPGPTVCTGDLNCDGTVGFGDINPFVLYLSNYSNWQATYVDCNPVNGDINGDGSYPSFGDINPFVTLLSTNPIPQCP